MYTVKTTKTENIQIAENILLNMGLKDFRFCDYSDYFGVSVYFLTSTEKKIRVSDHSVTSSLRMQEEFLFNFDMKQLGLKGDVKLKDNQKTNFLLATKIYKIV